MLDKLLREPKDHLLAPITRPMARSIHPTLVTGAAFAVGLVACFATSQQLYGLGLGCWLLNRVLDGLDGTLARMHNKQSDLGGYLDMLLDTIIYALLPCAVVLSDPSVAAWISLAFLLTSFYTNGASWMYLAALLEKRRHGAQATGELTTITMPTGLIEGAETVLFYSAFLLVPALAVELFWLMGALVCVTAVQRVVWAARNLSASQTWDRKAVRSRSC